VENRRQRGRDMGQDAEGVAERLEREIKLLERIYEVIVDAGVRAEVLLARLEEMGLGGAGDDDDDDEEEEKEEEQTEKDEGNEQKEKKKEDEKASNQDPQNPDVNSA